MPNSYSTFHPPNTHNSKNLSVSTRTASVNPTPTSQTFTPSFTPIVQPRELPRQRLPESFNQVTALSSAFSLRSEPSVSLYRARMENRNVVLRVLKGWLNLYLSSGFLTSDFQDKAFVDFISLPSLFLPSTDSADATERHNFLSFASFLAQLGPHPFLPELLGVVSLRAPLVTVVEELENRDLLSVLWRCRQVGGVG